MTTPTEALGAGGPDTSTSAALDASPRRHLGNTAGLVAGRAVAAALSLAWMIVITRTLDEQSVGELSLGLTLAVALSVIPDMGLPMIVTDHVARDPSSTRALVRHVIRLRLLASVVTAVLLLAMYRLGTSATLAVPLLLAVSIAATTVHSTVTAALRGLGTVVPDSVNEVASRLFVLAVGTWLLASGGGIAAAAAVLAVADLLSAGVLVVVVRRHSSPGSSFPSTLVARRTVLPLAAALLVASLHTRIDVWLLALIGSADDVAHYVVPARLAEGLLLPAGVASALVLALTAKAPDERTRGRRAIRYVGAVTLVVAAAAAALAALAVPVIDTAFGREYRDDADVLRLLCLAAVPSAMSVGLAPVVAILARRSLFRWVLVALVVNVSVNLLLVPGHREVGAAWASVVSMSVAAIGMIASVLRPGRQVAEAPS